MLACQGWLKGVGISMTLLHSGKSSELLLRVFRGAMVLVCLSVAAGNSLVGWLLSSQSHCICVLPAEESPAEEVPAEAQLPAELVELDEFTSHRPNESQRRKRENTFRHYLFIYTRLCELPNRLSNRTSNSERLHRNGCGANLRC